MRFHTFLSQTYILWRRYVWCTKGFKFGWPGDKGGRIKTVREDRVREDKVREDKVREDKVREDKVREDKVREDKVREDQVREDKVRKDKLRENKVREDKVREDKVREDKGGRIHKVRDLCVYKIEVQITDPYKICIKTISFAQDKDI